MKVWTIVVAGGNGSRFGGQKQFEKLCGKPLVEWATSVSRQVSEGVILVVPQDCDKNDYLYVDAVTVGGNTRSQSVRQGLSKVPDSADIVIIHDCARPLASKDLFERVISAVEGGADGAIPGVAVSDTLKRSISNNQGFIEVHSTLEREGVYAVQTPQAFRLIKLKQAHESLSDASDDAHLVENIGGKVVIVQGDPRNIKVTIPSDFALCETLLGGKINDIR